MIDFNTQPYNDDYNEDDRFYRILFVPSLAVQARELTQLQTILQNQISRLGDHMFEEGAMVIPGQSSVDMDVQSVTLQPVFSGQVVDTYINKLNGAEVQGESGLKAIVQIAVPSGTGTQAAPTLYLKYTNSGTASEKVFSPNENVFPTDSTLQSFGVQVAAQSPNGVASIASIQRGVYYIHGLYALVLDQSIILDAVSNTPTARIGLQVNEKTVSSDDFGYEQLLDNAQGSFNFAAPGAHRYFIELILTALPIDSTSDSGFIELIRVVDGKIQRKTDTTQYSEIEKTLARRTYDESGDYTVTPFKIDIREHRNNDVGQWVSNAQYLIGDVASNAGNTYTALTSGTSLNIAPVHTSGTAYDGPGSTGVSWGYTDSPSYNRGVYSLNNGGDSSKLAIGLEPGKAYVRGYEIDKVSTEYVPVSKARTSINVNNAVIPATVGSYLLVSNVQGLPAIDSYGSVDLYDQLHGSSIGHNGNKIGSANVQFIEWHDGTIGTSTFRYKLSLFNVQLLPGYDLARNLKAVYSTAFAADVAPLTRALTGSITASTTAVTGVGTSFLTDFNVGDYVIAGGMMARVSAIASQSALTLSAAFSGTVTGLPYGRVETNVLEPENSSLVFPFPYAWIKSVRSTDNTNDTSYAVYSKLSGAASSASGATCTLSISSTAGTFASAADLDNYIVCDSDGTIIVPQAISVSGSVATLTLAAAYAGHTIGVVAAVNKSGTSLTEKSKSLVSETKTISTQASATAPVIPLGHADGLKIVSIKMGTGDFTTPGTYDIDISDRFTFDNGQQQSYYGLASLTRKPSFSAPTAPIQIEWQYLSHSTGDYFTVNSYPNNMSYSDIPSFGNLELRDTIDFRPRINDAGTGFSGAGSSMSSTPKRGVDVRADFDYYIGRKVKIALDFSGNFFSIDGVSSIAPKDPDDPSTGMVLYTLELAPYTEDTSDASVAITSIDNKRYTMRDIGKLESRIGNLEYYTSLNLLEQQTSMADVVDSNGDSRFKNGFIVDGFNGHGVGNPNDPDYLCAVDMGNKQLRPYFSMQNIGLVEKNSSDSQRSASGYGVYGEVATLPIKAHIPLITQPYASRLENINPFAVFTFLGDVTLTPETDDWFEVNRLPDLIVNVEGNYNTLKTIAQNSGALNTVWNSWQTAWTGSPVVTSTYTNNLSTHDNGKRYQTIQTYATQVGQIRTGTAFSLQQSIDMTVVDDKVISTAVIPYIRSRNVLVQVKGLKPDTKFFPYFDDVSVGSFCTPASRLVYGQVSGKFDASSYTGGQSTEAARRVKGDTEVCLSKGDVIVGGTSGATAVVVGTEYIQDINQYALYVSNVIGTFSASESIVGSISNAIGTFSSIELNSAGSDAITNFAGELYLLFDIPDTDSNRFRTGTREFKLVDSSTANGEYTSRGTAQYTASGILQTKQQTVNAVRNAKIVQNQVTSTQTIVQTSSRVVSDTGWYDPLAQSFLVDQAGGAFLTKVDVFFSSKDPAIPVTLELRDITSGVPGKNVLPFSRVTKRASDVNISVGTVLLDGANVPDYNLATTFEFPSPVYVEGATEYAIVLSSDSNKYQVWVSNIGDQIPGSSRTISEQPYLGSLFKSQNASTWTPSQLEDLKFTLYRAQFDTSAVGDLEFVNTVLPYQDLDTDPFEFKSGQTKIRVYQSSHGMPSGSKVIIRSSDPTTISGTLQVGTISYQTSSAVVTGSSTLFTGLVAGSELMDSNGTYLGVVQSITSDIKLTLRSNATLSGSGAFNANTPIGTIPARQLLNTFTIGDVVLDSYTVSLPVAPTVSGYFGSTTIQATQNVQFDLIQPSVQSQLFPGTTLAYGVKATTGKSPDSPSETPYITASGFTPVAVNDSNVFTAPMMVASELNEQQLLGGNKSFTFNVTLTSDNEYLSPVIDFQRTSLIAVSNKVDSPTESTRNVAGLDDNLIGTFTTVAFTANGISTSDSATQAKLAVLTVGKYLNISGSSGSNNGAFMIQSVASDGSSVTLNGTFSTVAAGPSIVLTQRESFTDDTAPSGASVYSQYVSKRISLASSQYPSDTLRINFSSSIPLQANVRVFFKVSPVGSQTDFTSLPYTEALPDMPLVKSQSSSGVFSDSMYTVEGLTPFDAVQVKLELISTSTSQVPLVKELRIIACA